MMFDLVNPASGANNVVVTSNIGSTTLLTSSSSFSGCGQGALDGFTSANDDTTGAINPAITTVIDNCWLVLGVDGLNPGSSNGSLRDTQLIREAIIDSNGPYTPPGSYSLNGNSTGYPHMAGVMVSIAPVVATNFTRSLSDSILNGASRSATLARVAGFPRALSDAITTGASRGTTVARIIGFPRAISDSILRGASRNITVARMATYGRSLSDSIMNAASRFVRLYFSPEAPSGVAEMRSDIINSPIGLDDATYGAMRDKENDYPLGMEDQSIL